ncbi:MarR family winged helix-turn-helix transcriptional regulator [Gordonia sp. SL306]|uniref:MarR family winged helix-turn-helix transcriptional regulator n=1 Tax=Gordonia sp. SL306 TaxID=2995145 RepID=UPI00226F21C2|nr:MarR family transcriptional regulator [Gordonia sp. SL306]WAC56278.1 MarR family transcriptional regulator [Gordonia sp. SL306]
MTDVERPELDLIHRIRALTIRLDLLGASFAGRNRMHPTDVRALIALLDAERDGRAASPGELGSQLQLNSASVTALVDRLERADLVARERVPGDRRRVRLTVTDRARELGWEFFGPLIERALGVVDEFSEAELDVVRRFVTALDSAVGEADTST